MVKCRWCSKKAVIFMREHRLALCEDCYPNWFLRMLERTIEKWKMLKKDEKILVAISGGKDSVAVWYCLSQLGYLADGIHVVISDTEYSIKSKEAVIKISEIINRPVHIIEIKKEFGKDIGEISQILRRENCSACSMIKRNLLNKFAYDNNYDVIVTGHNLDDEVAVLFGNVLKWNLEYLVRQSPVLLKEEGFVKKIKPFIRFTDEEIKIFAKIKNLPFVEQKCPFSKGATSLVYKDLLNKLEEEMPLTKWTFYSKFLSDFQKLISEHITPPKLNFCKICNSPTILEICALCRIKEKIKQKN